MSCCGIPDICPLPLEGLLIASWMVTNNLDLLHLVHSSHVINVSDRFPSVTFTGNTLWVVSYFEYLHIQLSSTLWRGHNQTTPSCISISTSPGGFLALTCLKSGSLFMSDKTVCSDLWNSCSELILDTLHNYDLDLVVVIDGTCLESWWIFDAVSWWSHSWASLLNFTLKISKYMMWHWIFCHRWTTG